MKPIPTPATTISASSPRLPGREVFPESTAPLGSGESPVPDRSALECAPSLLGSLSELFGFPPAEPGTWEEEPKPFSERYTEPLDDPPEPSFPFPADGAVSLDRLRGAASLRPRSSGI